MINFVIEILTEFEIFPFTGKIFDTVRRLA